MVGSPASPLAREAFDAALRQNGNVEDSQKLREKDDYYLKATQVAQFAAQFGRISAQFFGLAQLIL